MKHPERPSQQKESRLVAGRPISVCRPLRLCPSAFSALKLLAVRSPQLEFLIGV
jgi:hypothetical protein